jgi:hypothetical protein
MIVSGGHLIGIDHVETDGVSILGDGVLEPLKVNPDAIDYYSAGPGIALNEKGDSIEIENTDHIFIDNNPEYIVSGDEMSAYLYNNRYSIFSVPEEVKKLTIKVFGTEDESTVSRTMFEFVKEGDTEDDLEKVQVLGDDETECLMNAPMNWPGTVTYHGVVVNNIATILGYTSADSGTVDPSSLITSSGDHLVTENGDYITFEIDPTEIDDNPSGFIVVTARNKRGRWIPDRSFNELVDAMNSGIIPTLRVLREWNQWQYLSLYKYKPNEEFIFRAPVETTDDKIVTTEFTYKLRSFEDTSHETRIGYVEIDYMDIG